MLILSAASCQTDLLAVEPPAKHVDPSVTQECATVVDVPHRYVPYDEASRLWARDRAALGDCGRANHAKALTIKALLK